MFKRGLLHGYDVVLNIGDTLRSVLSNGKQTNEMFKEDFNNGGIGVIFEGSNAEAQWQRRKEKGNTLVAGTIHFPELKPDTTLTRQQADNFVGYGLHELGHMCYSDPQEFDALNRSNGGQAVAIMNALEDPRIEEAMSASHMAPNSKMLFEQVTAAIYAKAQSFKEKPYDPNSLSWLPVTLALLGRERRGYRFPEGNDIRKRMDPLVHKLIDEALSRMDGAPLNERGSKVARETAEWLIEQLQLPPQPQDPQQGQGQGQGGQGQGKGKPVKGKGQANGKGKAEKSDGKSQGKGRGDQHQDAEEDGEGQGDAESGAEGAQDTAKLPGSLGSPESRDAGDTDASGDGADGADGAGEGEADGQGDGEGKDGDDADEGEEPGHGFSKRGPGARWRDVDFDKTTFQEVTPESAVQETAKQVGKSGGKLSKLPSTTGWPYAYNRSDQHLYRELRNAVPANIGGLRHALWRLLNSRDEAWLDRYREFGRWDNRAFPRMLTGSDSVYRQTREVQGMKTAVSIVLDLSGSMNGAKVWDAAVTCIALAEVLEQLSAHGVAYEIIGFEDQTDFAHKAQGQTNAWWQKMQGGGHGRTLRHSKGNFARDWFSSYGRTAVVSAGIPIFKNFNEKLPNVRGKVAAIAHYSGGGTPDVAGVMQAIKDVLNRPEPNKVVISIGDGMGFVEEVQNACKFASTVGVDVIGIGIGVSAAEMKQAYPIAVAIRSSADLPKAAFGKLVDVVLQNRITNNTRVTVT